VACFKEDFEACIAHLHCPPGHRRVIRATNLLERLLREERRRVNAAATLFGERAVLKLMYASLVRAFGRWRGLGISEFERRQLERHVTSSSATPGSGTHRSHSRRSLVSRFQQEVDLTPSDMPC